MIESNNKNIVFEACLASAKAGNSKAQYDVALLFLQGNGTGRDVKAFLHWASMAYENGYPDALNALARFHRISPAEMKFVIEKKTLRKIFKEIHGYWADLDNPRSLSEKLQWIKLHCDLSVFGPYVDKYRVRDFVSKKAGERYLIPLLGVYQQFDEIDFNVLPDKFVIKASHGCGWHYFVKDKNSENWAEIKTKVDSWMATNYYQVSGERNYQNIKPGIVIEQYMESDFDCLLDYKFYCCNGEPLGLHVDLNRFSDHSYRIYDTQWREFEKIGSIDKDQPQIPRPENLDEMLDVCRQLSKSFSYVRVDLYNINGRIYFGELTFTPGSGFALFNPLWSDFYFGEPLNVHEYVAGIIDE